MPVDRPPDTVTSSQFRARTVSARHHWSRKLTTLGWLKMTDMKMTDQVAWREIGGHEIANMKLQDFCSTIRPLCFGVDLVGIVCRWAHRNHALLNFTYLRWTHYAAISCPATWSVNFMSCIFMSCYLVRHFHVLQFHALQLGPSISCPAISCPSFSATPMKCIVCKLFVSMSLFWQLIFDVAFLYSYITSGCCSIVIICSVHLTADCCSSTTTIIVWQDSILERGSAAFQRRPGWSKWVVNRKF